MLVLLAIVIAVISTPLASPAAPATAAAPSDPTGYESGRVFAKFKRGVASIGQNATRRAQATHELAPSLGWVSIPVAPGTEAQMIRELRVDPSVAGAQADYYLQFAAAFPSDPGFLDNVPYDVRDPVQVRIHQVDELQRQWLMRNTQIAESRHLARGNANTIIATIDSGAALAHPDLEGRLLRAANFVVGEEGRLDEEDRLRHGTGVAGIFAAKATTASTSPTLTSAPRSYRSRRSTTRAPLPSSR